MPSSPIHPGEILKDELAAIDMNAAQLARSIHVPANRISQIVAGKRNISADTALRLGKLFNTGPQFWLNLQVAYELDLAKESGVADLSAIIPYSAALHSELAAMLAHGQK
ncbi:MAG: HigA family addiction module antidote protein [Deltaproteobacteria bacterium]|nr:HigA family addiction module antidote protein [Deltaproteobacteria bacterium]